MYFYSEEKQSTEQHNDVRLWSIFKINFVTDPIFVLVNLRKFTWFENSICICF